MSETLQRPKQTITMIVQTENESGESNWEICSTEMILGLPIPLPPGEENTTPYATSSVRRWTPDEDGPTFQSVYCRGRAANPPQWLIDAVRDHVTDL